MSAEDQRRFWALHDALKVNQVKCNMLIGADDSDTDKKWFEKDAKKIAKDETALVAEAQSYGGTGDPDNVNQLLKEKAYKDSYGCTISISRR